MADPIFAPISPALLAKQLSVPKPEIYFDSMPVGHSQIVPYEGTDLTWVRNAAKWNSRERKDGSQRRFTVLADKAKNTIEVARLA